MKNELASFLKQPRSKQIMDEMAVKVCNDPNRLSDLLSFIINKQDKSASRAAWLMRSCFQLNPNLFKPHLNTIISNIRVNPPEAIKRNTYAILSELSLEDQETGILLDYALKDLESKKSMIAVKVYAMKILVKICKQYPEMKNELKLIISNQMPHASPGFASRGRKTLKEIVKIGQHPN